MRCEIRREKLMKLGSTKDQSLRLKMVKVRVNERKGLESKNGQR